MIDQLSIIVFIVFVLVAANLPWVCDRQLVLFLKPSKTLLVRWFEWFVLYLVCGIIAFIFEQNVMGHQTTQAWEFYVVTLCLFVVFALPGFVYYVDLKKLLKSR